MTETKVRSWIWLATSLASQKEPAEIGSITMIADGINHSVPKDRELKSSLDWLLFNGLILKKGNKFCLTEFRKKKFENASKKTSILFKIWDNLDEELRSI